MCVNDPAGSPCNDGLFCTAVDTCNGAGVCSGSGTPCTSVGDNDCNCNESCNESQDACNAQDPQGSNCGGTGLNDGICEFGVCVSLACI